MRRILDEDAFPSDIRAQAVEALERCVGSSDRRYVYLLGIHMAFLASTHTHPEQERTTGISFLSVVMFRVWLYLGSLLLGID